MAAATEGTPPPFVDLTGEYVLDKENSDSIAPFLKEVGAPWIARKAADSMSMTITIAHTKSLFEVTNSSIFRTMKNSLTIGEESEFTAGDGSTTPMMTKVLSTGNIHCSGAMPNNSEKRIENEYSLSEDRSRLHLRMKVKSKDGTKEHVNLQRQFVRKAK